MEQFKQDIAVLTETTVSRAIEAIQNKEDETFFIGRGTCPYCRKFATKLSHVVKETGAKVYFINSEEPSELEALKAFRDKYNMPTVPAFLHVHGEDVFVKCDSSMSEEEIKTFMHA
ncbi:thioredoxin [Granulicatella sp. zg-ZJ]|uniref:conjugal transfer protein TraF n=1 Tax=unclassified Granulicatella TaxID=2630493 RepID=UPI0013C1F289|nr:MULTISPECIES: conjugal transfer protein TraF [unclassified Granulicatella]MBS4749941.1 conjugal transfer protein TraF [Carnobacteriaceae bacterium zg-ZUI78]NEW62061.1 thioredoxin [Granulicatella sp. zg-ZJ]NEW66141.1 thioredoxin [Granulicatella sp. zg-84]QMI86102.1 conjugal transfer protein TraF [Carnobacteriaceae bacterium zg-84]